jgi:hypothetical protein
LPHSGVTEGRKKLFRIIETLIRLASIAVVILATELTISWNRIQNVNETKSVGQLIPLVLGVGAVGHLLLAANRPQDTSNPEPEKPEDPEKATSVSQQDPYNIIVLAANHRPKKHKQVDYSRIWT